LNCGRFKSLINKRKMCFQSLKELNDSVVHISKKLLKENEINCAICSHSFCDKNPPIKLTGNTIDLVINILGFNSTQKVCSVTQFNSCPTCYKIFLELTETFAMLNEIKLHFIDLRLKVGKKLIIKTLERPVNEYDDWKNIIQSTENEFPTNLVNLQQANKNFLRQLNNDVKLNKVTVLIKQNENSYGNI